MRCVLSEASIMLRIVVLTFSCTFKFWQSVWCVCYAGIFTYLLFLPFMTSNHLMVYMILTFIENLHRYVVHVFCKIQSLKEVVCTFDQVMVEEFLRLIRSIWQHDLFWHPCWRTWHCPNHLVHDVQIWEAGRRRVGPDLTPVSPCSICWRQIQVDLPTLV